MPADPSFPIPTALTQLAHTNPRQLQDAGAPHELDLDLAVGLLGCRSDGPQKRQHLAPLDVAARAREARRIAKEELRTMTMTAA